MLALHGCQGDAGSAPIGFRDAGSGQAEDAGNNRGDASASFDGGASSDAGGGFGDSGIDYSRYGRLVAPLPAELVGVAGEDHVVYLRADGTLMATHAESGGERALGVRPTLIVRPAPHVWMWSELSADNEHGTLLVYRAGNDLAEPIADRVSTDGLLLSPDGEWALFFGDLRIEGSGATSTRTADLMLASADGAETRTVLEDVHLGRWERTARRHTGPCSTEGSFARQDSALLILCRGPDSERRELLALDLSTGRTATVASDVHPFLRTSPDGAFALYLDRSLQLHGVSTTGEGSRRLDEDSRVADLTFLDGDRFAYVTSQQELLVAEWPELLPELLVPFGVEALEGASPTGDHVLFRQNRAMTGLRDLWLVETSSPATPRVLNALPDGYPGDDAFSEDGEWVRWFSGADVNFIGDVLARPVNGAPVPVLLATRAWYVLNYADAERVLLMVNASVSMESRRIIADLATRRSDGSDALQILVPRVDPASFHLFPDRRRVVYRVPEGAPAGLWVKSL